MANIDIDDWYKFHPKKDPKFHTSTRMMFINPGIEHLKHEKKGCGKCENGFVLVKKGKRKRYVLCNCARS